MRHSHEQTGLSTGTVTDDDQLATDFRHLRDGSTGTEGGRECGIKGVGLEDVRAESCS